ncbi:organic hydroperoxide resistance protein [Enterobacter asburiae]|uniref:organic hydroperoxide resistance protein n=1 Tax=Enterobacter asburiae TaxID=61645 RepID=UPI000A41C6C7|nr:organic hydroperoxide resistance protein [Enterobacter asburiae]MCB4611707.1 organic hydroperoxide resistance protein [Enterobacter asburiae]
MPITPSYTAEAVSTGDGRNGHVRSSDGLLDTDVALPKAMGGAGKATNPEQLFAAGYAACFHSALRHIAQQDEVSIGNDTSVTVRVGVGLNGSGGFGLEVALTTHLPGLEKTYAEELAARAHATCPYSNAVRGNVAVSITTNV